MNDSENEYNSHLDRHQKLGEGFIKIDNLIKFIIPYKKIPMILETSPPYDKQINLLK